jgi:hypothetical protein
VGFWGSIDRCIGIEDASKIPEIRVIFTDFGGTGPAYLMTYGNTSQAVMEVNNLVSL